MTWGPFDGGTTIGTQGSEGGVIVRDEEHELGSRITLERGAPTAPFAVTCGIYGAMFHTAWAGTEEGGTAMYAAMRDRLTRILETPSEDEAHALIQRLVDDF